MKGSDRINHKVVDSFYDSYDKIEKWKNGRTAIDYIKSIIKILACDAAAAVIGFFFPIKNPILMAVIFIILGLFGMYNIFSLFTGISITKYIAEKKEDRELEKIYKEVAKEFPPEKDIFAYARAIGDKFEEYYGFDDT